MIRLCIYYPDPEIRLGGGGEAGLTENFLRPFGPQFGLKIRGEAGAPGPSPGSPTVISQI